MKADVILWDYDGTLVNSVTKNIAITKEILAEVAPRLSGENLPHYLLNEADYHVANHQAKNWQDLYKNYYGLTEEETQLAGSLWSAYQLKNTTPVKLFTGIKEIIDVLDLPHGVCSQNSSVNISMVLQQNNVLHQFNAIVGYDDVPGHAQKPSPLGGLLCLEKIFGVAQHKTIIYIGDHEADVEFARNLQQEISDSNTVVSIAAAYSGADTSSWNHQPDFKISSPLELLQVLNR